ncbi:hypothetical protein P154DRAFT_521581 [Amniculicola lignicola CBS 123094]|uniref:RING-type domain-containing protein n=1 Tax=Amniculicola lignicola CBS 123094 TaxID=1392246 RepID=A0A6A5WKP3_9PLEO|nr:hypothetical protein P154DRAFT_521581 [Amniculicola lignicola CBS 123094]
MPPPKNPTFTSHERAALKSRWGTQTSRLTRDSFLPFGSCQLCLLPSVDPVSCPSGDLFCRECAMTNLLAQRKEIKRVEKENERRRVEEGEEEGRREIEERVRAVEDFELVQMGLSVKHAGSKVVGRENGKVVVVEQEQDTRSSAKTGDARGTKRKFVLDEDELKRIASEERSRARLVIDEERRAAKGQLPSFWVPSETPEDHHLRHEAAKLSPTCPCSDPARPHPFSLKGLISVHFEEEKDPSIKEMVRTCPSCHKSLSNTTKAVVAVPCGHVLCKPCADKFLKAEQRHHRDAHDVAPVPDTIHCYVCDADVTPRKEKEDVKEGKKKSKKDKERGPRPGLVEIKSEGTGYASAGKSEVKKAGVAFQV